MISINNLLHTYGVYCLHGKKVSVAWEKSKKTYNAIIVDNDRRFLSPVKEEPIAKKKILW